MGYIKDEILQAANSTSSIVSEVEHRTSDAIRVSIRNKYTTGSGKTPLWKDLVNDVSIQDADGWKLVGDFINHERAIMFFDEDEEIAMFTFESGLQMVLVLAESIGFEFYVTNASTDYVICFNHHDFLITTGKAAFWLENRNRREGNSTA